MPMTSEFIAARALTLSYEARRFPETAHTALMWINRAVKWAQKRHLWDLADEVDRCAVELLTRGIIHPESKAA